MDKFVGTGYLLDVSNYTTKKKDAKGEVILGKDGKPVVVEKIKYTFLCGTQETAGGFMSSPHVEVTVVDADAPLLEEVGFMLPIRISVEIKNKLTKVDGQWQELPTPSYNVLGNIIEE